MYILGDGAWDSLVRLWINNVLVTLPDTTKVHFHPGIDGEIGFGMGKTSTGGDQHVDAFWTDAAEVDAVTFSRYAYLALKVPPDPKAPSAELTVLADYQALKCRAFDSSGNQTAFAWTQNPAWWICDFLLRRFVLREAKANQPLVAAEKARFDWPSFVDAAAYCDVDIGGGVKRFSDGGLVFLESGLTADRALEQMLLLCRGHLLERSGKIGLYCDQARSSVFTFRLDNVLPGTFKVNKTNVRPGKNQIVGNFRDINLAAGSSDNATRFSIATKQLDHKSHQFAIGVRGPGLSIMPKVQALALDFGNNTPERVDRLMQYQLVRQLGDDVSAGETYVAPVSANWEGYEDSLAVEPGDLVTIDPSISEEYGGKLIEVLEIEECPDGTRGFSAGLEYQPNAFPDVAASQQSAQATDPADGLPIVVGHANYSYRPTSNPLAATDAGSSDTVNVANFDMRIAGKFDVPVTGAPITLLSRGALYFIYYDDPDGLGGAVSFIVTTVKETALAGGGRFFIGSILTPVAGGADTIGNNDGGSGAQTGGHSISTPTVAETGALPYLTPTYAFDWDASTAAYYTDSNVSMELGQEIWKAFSTIPGMPQATNVIIKTLSSVTKTGTGTPHAKLEYSINGGSTWVTIYDVTAARSKQADAVTLGAGQNIGLIQIRGTCWWGGGTGSITHNVHEIWLDVLT